MKKIITILASLVLASSALADANDPLVWQRDPSDCCDVKYDLPQPPASAHGVLIFNGITKLIEVPAFGSGLTLASGVLSVTAPWSGITGLPSTLAGYGIADAYPLSGNPSNFVTASALSNYLLSATAASTYATQSALSSGLAAKFNTPSGSTAQYVRGDGTLATLPSAPAAFNFSMPSTRTLAVSTSYQATDTSKAAVITPSLACTNATTVLAASACTAQVRMHTSAVTCSTGTVALTVSQTVNLGLLFTQAQTVPAPIMLPAGAHFILCPTAGTFTVSAVEQSAG